MGEEQKQGASWVDWLFGRKPPKVPRIPESEMAGGHRGVAMGSRAAPDRSAGNVANWEQLTGHEVENFAYSQVKLRLHSSNAAWAQYNHHDKELDVGFNNGGVYRYSNVDVREAIAFIKAASKGSWLWDNIRVRGSRTGHKKPYRKLR